MTRFEGVSETGMERSRVVEVPRERTASPGAASEITVAGLSPVNGATLQPRYVHVLLGGWLENGNTACLDQNPNAAPTNYRLCPAAELQRLVLAQVLIAVPVRHKLARDDRPICTILRP